MLEVDASESCIRAVLSQLYGDKPKLHPVALWKFSGKKLGHRKSELLAIKLTLKEWQQWLDYLSQEPGVSLH